MKSKSTKSNKKTAEKVDTGLRARLRTDKFRNDALIAVSVAATLGIMAWIIGGRPIGVANEWTWRTQVVTGARFWAPLPAAALLIAAAGWLTRPRRWENTKPKFRALWIILIFLFAWMLAGGLMGMSENPVAVSAAMIASPQVTSYFNVATEIDDLPGILRFYARQMPTFPLHARTHPPGAVLFFYGIDRALRYSPGLTDAVEKICLRIDRYGTEDLAEVLNDQFGLRITKPDAMAAVLSAFLLAGVGSLTLFPLYWLTASLYGPVTALRAILLFATVPSFLLFAPSIDELVLLLAVLMLWSFHLWRARGNPLVGAVFALGLWVSLGLVVMGLFMALWWLAERLEGRSQEETKQLIIRLAGALGLFLAVILGPWVLLGLSFPDVVKAGLAAHRHVTLEEVGRTYWKWVIYDPIEFAVFLGLPVTVWMLAGIRGKFAWGWLGLLVLLNLSGWVRAEVGRIWLFLMPPAAMLAAARLGGLGKRFDFGFFSAMVLQLGQAITMKAGLGIFIPW